MRDRNDGKPWSAMDEADLILALERGDSIEEAAIFLCRSGTVEDVAAKALALGSPRGRWQRLDNSEWRN